MDDEIPVLLVDDEPAVAELAATHLERLRDGFDVTVAEGGAAALTRFERDPTAFDCIVSDYTMPEMNGLDLLAAVREIDTDRPFVLFTGKGSEEIASEAVSAGVTDYLQKGTGTEQYELLANRIENAVEAYRAERRADELARINGVINDVQRALVRESTRGAIEEEVCARLAESSPYTLAWIGEPDDEGRIEANERAGTRTAYLDEISVRTDDTPRGRGPAGRALRSDEVRTVRNLTEDDSFEPWAAAADRYGHESVIALPLSYDGTEYGLLVVYSSRRYAFGEEERTALAELAGTVGQAIHAAETRAALERRERELSEERAVAEGVFDAIPDAIYAFDPEGRMLRWNDAFAATVGYDDETIAGMNALEFVPEADRDLIADRITAVVERGETVTVESAFVTADGETIPHEFNGAPLTDSESVYGVIGSGRDITGRKRREAAIAALHESTRDLVRADDRAGVATATIEAAAEVLGFSATAVRLHDPDTDTLEPVAVSDAARRVLGERPSYSHGEALPWRALDSGEPVLTAGSIDEYGADDLPFESAMYVPLGDRGTLSIGLSDDAFDDVDIRLAQVLAANAAVALDRVARETQLKRHERMLDAAGDGIYALDTDGRFTTVNDTIVAKTGYTREELLGEHVSTFLEEKDIEHGRDLIRDLLSQDLFGSVSESFEATIHTADDDTFPCEFQIALLPRLDDEFQGTVGVIRDITERKARERELERYETMVETAPVGMFVVDPDGTVVGGNEKAGSMAGYPMTELRGKPFRTLVENGIVPPESIEKYTATVRDLLSADVERTTGSYELTITPPDGDRRTLRVRVSLLPYDTDFEGTVMICEDVTERKQRESELEAARARFRALAENTTLAVVTIDENSTVQYANDAVEAVFGYPAAELEGESLTTVMPERLHDSHFEGLDRYLREENKHFDWEWVELPGRHRDGREIELGVSFGEHVAEGEHRFTATIRDITARKRREAAIETLHDATRAMIDAADREEIAEIAVTTVERVLDMPMSAVWLYDEQAEALEPVAQSSGSRELFEPEVSSPTYTSGDSLSWQAFETGETRRYDHVDRESDAYNPETVLQSEIIVPLGEYGVLNISSTEPGAFDDDDVSLAKLLATNTEAALSRADRERQLVAQHDRLAALFENVPDAALRYDLVDGEPIVRDVNTAFEEVFGYPTEAVVGENIDEFIVPAEHDDEADDLNERLLTGERLRTTARRRTADGVRDFLLHVVPIDVGERNAEGYSIYTDITDQKRQQRELERQNELLEEFASVISHDLRNPLSVARGRLDLARAEHDSEHHDGIDTALTRMNDLIEDVLTLARQGRVIAATESVSVAAVAEQAWRTAGTETAELRIDDPGEIEADPDRLARLFENLFRNAVEHGSTSPPSHAQEDTVEQSATSSRPEAGDADEQGSTSSRATLDDAAEHAGGVAVTVGDLDGGGFFVADDGPGIPEGERENVFEGGYTTGDDGTGLGLSIVRSIAEAHDWTMTVVESDAGGARFEIRTQTADGSRA